VSCTQQFATFPDSVTQHGATVALRTQQPEAFSPGPSTPTSNRPPPTPSPRPHTTNHSPSRAAMVRTGRELEEIGFKIQVGLNLNLSLLTSAATP